MTVWLLLRFGSGTEGSITGIVTRYFQGEGTAGEGQGRSVQGTLSGQCILGRAGTKT